ncbi:hypothetical protein CTI12_AA290860 [Artemisia annua]|uniref:Uncharacterized protein n=1 Tax=Artemisia annua TaxID=35608 RepID=A0A2U1N9L7_ARTAN|nr:hypothetical protein CTI12_AA343690 [Artemisia annua]PWA70191.1 hypothetical protein CTI12_AA290860 [Artemisia annua]
MIIVSSVSSLLERLSRRWPMLVYATMWTTILTITVAVTSFAPELAFVWAIAPTSSFSRVCQHQKEGLVRVPFDVPSEFFCLPPDMFKKSKMDLMVPPIFAAVVVAASACFVRALGLWEVDEAEGL